MKNSASNKKNYRDSKKQDMNWVNKSFPGERQITNDPIMDNPIISNKDKMPEYQKVDWIMV